MKRIFTVLIVILAFAPVLSGIPIQDMGPKVLGAQYGAMVRGQTITTAQAQSQSRVQLFTINYAPVPYVLFTAGAGGSRFDVSPYRQTRFDGLYGIAPVAGIALFTPRFFTDVLSLTVGGQALYLNSANKTDIRYHGAVVNPHGGIKLSMGPYLDWEFGALGHLIYGSITNDNEQLSFSNNEIIRGYTDITLHDKALGVFLTAHFDASPQIGTDWSNGPQEASIGLSLGIMLSPDREYRTVDDRNSKWFPWVKKMREKQDEMANEIK